MSTHYQLLTVDLAAGPDEIKRAFRREIARYHPDKVQHLGVEFQQIAATRAAELTEAYRVLMDKELRRRYDASISAPQVSDPPPRTRIEPDGTAGFAVLRRAVLERIRTAVAPLRARAETVAGLDAGFVIDGQKGLFKKSEPDVRLLVRVVETADPTAIADAWKAAARAANPDGRAVCLLLLSPRLSPARDLAAAIAEQRRKHPHAAPLVIPADMRDWEALFPPDTPTSVRSLVDRLRRGE